MSTTQHSPAQTYRNVMEPLVVEEVEQQLQRLSAKVTSYVNKAEVIAYALNRLPALYATSEKGWEQQRIRARKELNSQILAAVRQAIAAIQRDPLRAVAPLKIGADQESQVILQELKSLLGQDDLSWRNLAGAVENALIRTAQEKSLGVNEAMQQRNGMNGKIIAITCRGYLMAHSRQFDRAMQVLLTGLLAGAVSNATVRAIAADPPTLQDVTLKPDSEPLALEALAPGNAPADLVTVNSISLTQLTVPSLWWLKEQIADQNAYGNRLLENWLAYPRRSNRPGRVDLVVNRQSWSLLDYLDRYAFIHVFGKAARDYGYNVRVFDGQATLLGASTCDFSTINIDALQNRQLPGQEAGNDRPAPDASLPPQPADAIACSILLDSSGKAGLRGGSNSLPGAGSAKALDTVQP